MFFFPRTSRCPRQPADRPAGLLCPLPRSRSRENRTNNTRLSCVPHCSSFRVAVPSSLPSLPDHLHTLHQLKQQQCSAFSFSSPRAVFGRQAGNIASLRTDSPALGGRWAAAAARKRGIGELRAMEVDVGLRPAQVCVCVCLCLCVSVSVCVCSCDITLARKQNITGTKIPHIRDILVVHVLYAQQLTA